MNKPTRNKTGLVKQGTPAPATANSKKKKASTQRKSTHTHTHTAIRHGTNQHYSGMHEGLARLSKEFSLGMGKGEKEVYLASTPNFNTLALPKVPQPRKT